MVQMSLYILVLSGLSEIGKKILNNNNRFEENADFGHSRPFLAKNGSKMAQNCLQISKMCKSTVFDVNESL